MVGVAEASGLEGAAGVVAVGVTDVEVSVGAADVEADVEVSVGLVDAVDSPASAAGVGGVSTVSIM